MAATVAIRVLVVDDGALVRAGFRSLLQTFEGVDVLAEAGDGAEALELIARYHPQVVLMDISMPRLNGLEALERISKEFLGVRVVIVSVYASEEFVVHALRAGAAGYLTKSSSPAELELAVRAAARGDTYLSPVVAKFVMGDYVKRLGPSSPLERLTPRQREILQLVAEGHSSKEIAKTLELSVNTVDAHRTQLMNALDIHDVAGLVRFAIRTGLTSADT
jgi:DNA-binding NarL/FixJ family response regulator